MRLRIASRKVFRAMALTLASMALPPGIAGRGRVRSPRGGPLAAAGGRARLTDQQIFERLAAGRHRDQGGAPSIEKGEQALELLLRVDAGQDQVVAPRDHLPARQAILAQSA